MNQRKSPLIWLLVTALLGMIGYAGYRIRARQSATLARIVALDACLAASNQQRALAAGRTVNGIKRSLCLMGNLPRDLLVLHDAERIQNRTQMLIDTLHMLREQMRKTNQRPKQAVLLSAQLNRYFAFVSAASKLHQPIAKLADAYAPVDLQGASVMALASLTYTELLLRRAEALALEQQGQKASNNYDGFDSIELRAVPTATTVAPGADYQAQLLLAWRGRNNSCSVLATAEVNGVRVSALTGQAIPVAIKISASNASQPHTVRAQWQGSIWLQRYPDDTVLRVAVPYLIVKRASL